MKISKIWNTLVLAIMLILFIGIQTTFAQTVWNGNIDTDWYTGNTSATEYTITTPQQLAGLAKLVNSGKNFKGKTVKLGANIMLNDTVGWENWASKSPANKWTPIGTKDSMCIFNGIFDGINYIVSGVYINNTSNAQGLFRNVDSSGIIKNLGVVASYIKGNFSIGGLVGGYNQGTISNSHFIGSVIGDTAVGGLVGGNLGTINNSYSNSKVTGTANIGGLTGFNGVKGVINNSHSIGIMTGNLWIGGLVGENGGDINNSYSTGTVKGVKPVGGLVGLNIKGGINNSYATVSVMGEKFVGGLVGLNNEESKINSSYSTGIVIGKTAVGGLVGYNNKSNVNKSYSTGTVTAEDCLVGGLVGQNNEGEISNSYSTGTVTAEDWGAGGLVGQNDKGKISKSYSIGAVTVVNFNVGGLVGANGGDIDNSYSSGTVKGGESVGGLVGQNHSIGGFVNSYGDIVSDISIGTIINSYSISEVIGGISNVSGLVGDNEGDKVINSYYESQIGEGPSYYYKGDGKTMAQMKQRTTFKNWDFNKIWGIKSTINNGYPYLLENKLVTKTVTQTTAEPANKVSYGNSFKDSRDDKKYRTAEISNQTWMVENLNYNAKGSKCYENRESNCQKYGRLYDWNTAMKACPKGWHLPSNEEWGVLMTFVNITDAYSFAALPGGGGDSDGSFNNVGKGGYLWSASESYTYNAYAALGIRYIGEYVSWLYLNKDDLYSVRCLQD
jgi:uncharacterized protein (TIGR02145 family)